MARTREQPYAQFNFLVNFGDGLTLAPQAGFQELSQHRPGKDAFHPATELTMKRGVISAPDLRRWLDDAQALRTVTIELMSEDRSTTVQRWRLINARITAHTSDPVNAKSTDVAMEALILSCERLELA